MTVAVVALPVSVTRTADAEAVLLPGAAFPRHAAVRARVARVVPCAAVGPADPMQADRSARLQRVRSLSDSVATCSTRVLASSVRPRTARSGSGSCQAGSRSRG